MIPRATRATTTTITTMTMPTMIPALPPPEGEEVGSDVGVREAHVSRLPIIAHVPHRPGLLGPRQPEFIGHEEWQDASPDSTHVEDNINVKFKNDNIFGASTSVHLKLLQ